MPIPPDIANIIDRLDRELEKIEQNTREGLSIVRTRLDSFPNNKALIQIFAFLGNYLVFVEVSRRRINYVRIILLADTITESQIQQSGEELSELLGRVLEAKTIVERLKNRLSS
jgi:hypothetical protein